MGMKYRFCGSIAVVAAAVARRQLTYGIMNVVASIDCALLICVAIQVTFLSLFSAVFKDLPSGCF